MELSRLDLAIVIIYAVAIFVLAQWVSREKESHRKDAQDYFLASRALPWWAIGTSLIAANISAEQIIGMSGSGYVIGLAIASYEWMAAITLVIVGKYFVPIFLKNGIYTMPEFLERRYSPAVRTTMAVFWLGVYIFVNLTAILWLGATAVHTVTGMDVQLALIALGVFAGAYALYGGLKAVALTDVVQVSLLVFGGLLISYLALDRISGGEGVVAGFTRMTAELPGKFDMILSADNPNYKDLPGLSVLLGGMWVMNVSYWGFNQYIIQRALGAKSIREAQKGIVLAAFLKLLMPVIIVLPGIAAVMLAPGLARPDEAYPHLMAMLPSGILGLVFAALLAAIVASLGSKINSIATIFTMDLYRAARPDTGTQKLVVIGRIAAVVSLLIAIVSARAAARQLRPGLPVHPGIHRLLHARHLRDLPARHVLGARDFARRDGRGHRLGGPLVRPQDAVAVVAVHGSRRHRVPRLHRDRGRAVVARKAHGSLASRRTQEHRLLDEHWIQRRRGHRRGDTGRALRDLVVSCRQPGYSPRTVLRNSTAGSSSLPFVKSKSVAFSQCEPVPHRVRHPVETQAGSQ